MLSGKDSPHFRYTFTDSTVRITAQNGLFFFLFFLLLNLCFFGFLGVCFPDVSALIFFTFLCFLRPDDTVVVDWA